MAQKYSTIIKKPVVEEESANKGPSVQPSLPSVQKVLAHLTPSQELKFYRKKIKDMSRDIEDLFKEVDRCQAVSYRNHELEKELVKQTESIADLQKAVSDLQECLHEEREQVLLLYSENQKLKLERKEENRIVARILANPDRVFGSSTIARIPHILTGAPRVERQQQRGDNQEQEIHPPVCNCDTHACRKMYKALKHLKLEYAEHLQFIAHDKEASRKEGDRLREKLQDEVYSLSARLKETQDELAKSVKDHAQWRDASRKREAEYHGELENMRSYLNKFRNQGETEESHHMIPGSGTDRTGGRRKDISSLMREINDLKEELARKDRLIDKYQCDCATLQDQLTEEKHESGRRKAVYKERMSKALAEIEHLKKNYKYQEHRRIVELQGFHSAIKLIRNRVNDLERHSRQVNHTLLKLTKPPVVHSKERSSAVKDATASASNLGKEIKEAIRKVEEVEAALKASE